MIDERIGQLEGKDERPRLRVAAGRASRPRSTIRATASCSARDMIRTRSTRRSARSSASRARPPDHLLPARRHAVGSRQFGRLGACAHRLRPRAVERGQLSCSCSARKRIAMCRPTRARLCADPPRDRAHRQGRPQIWLLSRRRDPAPGRTRSDHPVAVLDDLRHAPRQRAATRRSSARPSPIRRPRR